MHDLEAETVPPVGILIAIQDQKLDDVTLHDQLDELARLAKTFGIEIVNRLTQRRNKPEKATYLGPGKVETLAAMVEEVRATHPTRPIAVIADDELSPWQHRKLAAAVDCDDVLDRTGLILEIFHRHARSREARLQVELVRLSYLAPRLREQRKGSDVGRVRGGVGGKGAGESALELGRRHVRDRIAELRRELQKIEEERALQRARRGEVRCVALVGYTNAGKSTLMRTLTRSDVLVEDKLFATLDATVRVLKPDVTPRILVSDTVGFIRKLPHGLVASFKSTLDAALEAGILFHVVDASDPTWPSHVETTLSVLKDIGAGDIPMQFVFNKIDQLEDPEALAELRAARPDALFVCAHRFEDVMRVHAVIAESFKNEEEEYDITLRHDQGSVRAWLFTSCKVLNERYDGDGGVFTIRATPKVFAQLQAQLGLLPEPQPDEW